MTHDEVELEHLKRLEPTPQWLAELAGHGGEVIPIGPFLALMHPSSDALGFNFAVPIYPWSQGEDIREALHDLRRLFVERGHVPRLEFNEPLFPELAPLLEREGFVVEENEPLMICSPTELRPCFNPDVSVRFLQPTDADSDLIAYQTIFSEILVGKTWQPTADAVARFRLQVDTVKNGGHALAFLGATPVGTGFITALDGVCEITRVATIPAARRRGVAATLTSFMLANRFGLGDTLAWLTAADEIAQALYHKLGFRLVGARLYYRFDEHYA